MSADTYTFAPALTLEVRGDAAARAHFAAEYAAAAVPGSRLRRADVVADIRFARSLPAGVPTGGHKTVRWSVDLDPPSQAPLTVRLVLSGRPRRFALSLVQGFVVEPLMSLAAARADQVLLAAAALEQAGGAVVLVGRSRSGKTSVIARALAAGRGALGDDQVLLDDAAGLRSWPRRLRVYPDLRQTAPRAVAALPPGRRAALHALGALATASRGWVAPSLPLAWTDVGRPALTGPLPVHRVIVIERGGDSPAITETPLPPSAVIDLVGVVLAEQRATLRALAGPSWAAELVRAPELEGAALARALDGVPAERWSVPATWTAPRAVGALALLLGVGD